MPCNTDFLCSSTHSIGMFGRRLWNSEVTAGPLVGRYGRATAVAASFSTNECDVRPDDIQRNRSDQPFAAVTAPGFGRGRRLLQTSC